MGNSGDVRWLGRTLAVATIAGLMWGLGGAIGAQAQVGPGGLINPNKDCQTIRRCNFARGGRFRGCVSSYSCRTCRFVRASCTIGGKRRTCRQLRCTWGG